MEAAGIVLSAGGVVLSAAQTLLASLDSAALKKFMSDLEYKSQLDDLQQTVTALRAVLLDAEAKQELSHLQEYEFEKLKDVVFEADDLLDEFATLAQQNAGVTLSEKVCSFFSEAGVARRMSQGVESIKKKLEAIDYNTRFSFKHDSEPMRRRKPETCSLVRADDIIGRKEDLEKIVGLGKTALAQLVYNDSRVTSAFPLRLWASVSDHDQKQLDVKDILCQILASATNNEPQKDFTLEQVQKQLGHQLAGKKFLLVLDDVWSEKRDQWLNLEKFLIGGQKGSWILVTTRSLKTAKIIGGSRPYELEGLSEENSRRLFERMAFGLQSSNPPDDLVKIGQDIVKRCARVPLAIRVIGSLLYGQDKTLWVSLAQNPLANLGESQNDIMPILKLSYYNLESPLKSCFSYCALFPKDYEIEKEMLISLWMAQGYIVPTDGRSIEDVAEEYFSILLQRCFFQDVRTYEHVDTMYFKIHDLMHDVAQMVTKREICAIDNLEGNLNNKVRHLSVIRNKDARCSLDKSHIRTYLSRGYQHQDVKALMANCICLRALDLSDSSIKTLPKSIGDLLHLRYLDLSFNNELEVLPKSITKLCNLQTLNLIYCDELKELPEELSRLVKLRTLFTRYCSKLTCFPKGMGKLKNLHRLSDFIVGGEGSDSTTKQWFDGLEDLKAMNNLKGRLEIQFKWPKNAVKVDDSRSEGHYLSRKEHLKGVTFRFCHQEVDGGVDTEEATRFMEELQPHSNLERLEILGYRGVRMPSWITLIPKLVRIHLEDCKELEFMPLCLGNLQHLKFLHLYNLPKLEYIEIIPSGFRSEYAQGVSIFPSLKILDLRDLPKLKALGDDLHLLEDYKNMQLCLSEVTIQGCPELTSIPRCLKVDKLWLCNFNNRLEVLQTKRDEKIGEVPPSLLVFFFGKLWQLLFGPENLSKSSSIPIPTLKKVEIDNVMWLKSLHMVAFQSLERLSFSDVGGELESFEELEGVFRNCSSSLQNLTFSRCERLRSVCGGLEHLTALKELSIGDNCPNVRLSEETEDGKPWRSLHHSLRKLVFRGLSQLVSLPDWMQSLSALETLEIRGCKRLESIPNWMPKLTSLNRLKLVRCSESLKSRCQKDPPGEDWPYIKHIPIIDISERFSWDYF